MSNVLIGIIGVILFIGLALAGALFLGPRFQEATHNSKASAYIAQGKQIAQAMQLYRINEGHEVPLNEDIQNLAPSYLKAVPVGWWLYSLNSTNSAVAGFTVFDETPSNRSICLKVQIASGQVAPGTQQLEDSPSTIRDEYRGHSFGCIRYDDTRLAIWASA